MRLGLFVLSNQQSYGLGQLGGSFFLGLRYDLRMISILLVTMLILGSIPPLHPFSSKRGKKIWMTILGIATLVALFIFSVDFAHYAYLEQRLNASVLNYLEDAKISMGMVWQSYPIIRMVLGVLLVAALLIWLFNRTHKVVSKQTFTGTKRSRILSFIICFLIGGFFIFGRFNQYPLRWSDAFAQGSDYKAYLALNPFESFFSTLKFRHSTYDEKKVKETAPVIGSNLHFTPTENPLNFTRTVAPRAGAVTSKPNIVLVICESFSAYKSSMFGNPLNTTPFFDSLCQQGIFFDRCFTPTYGTARGVWATITGTPDVEMPKTASRNPAAVDQHTIINNFNGYEKFYFLGGSTSWANIRGVLTNNIDSLHLYEQEDYKAKKIDVWGISDKNLFLEANKVLAQQEKPFFAIVQTADNHRPYTIPEEDLTEFKKVQAPADSLARYGFESSDEMNAFRYTDFGYRKFMEAARKEKYFNNTIFVFIGDHGIPGNADALFPHSWTAQRLTTMHVPLLFYAPGLLAPQRVHTISSQVDVLPTIAGLSNITYRNGTLGKDLLDSATTGFAFVFDPDNSMTGVVKGNYLYRKQLVTKKEELVSIINNDPVPNDAAHAAIIHEMGVLTDALYETAKFMLLNNKKATR
ncbi:MULTISPECIES: LTA synthase family protein [Niastella]|uniref:LTA synthase family protein n=1 Tax=Niastella soli TaxID=2821487 RepID=A0ABS3YT81_9BACT|nr:LTA synthase family protein [Niastella soli]MBO9201111.1 LTA synthase family protein [Niastella soli]